MGNKTHVLGLRSIMSVGLMDVGFVNLRGQFPFWRWDLYLSHPLELNISFGSRFTPFSWNIDIYKYYIQNRNFMVCCGFPQCAVMYRSSIFLLYFERLMRHLHILSINVASSPIYSLTKRTSHSSCALHALLSRKFPSLTNIYPLYLR